MKTFFNPPMPHRVEQHQIGIRGFIAVKFMKQMMVRMIRVHQSVKLFPELLNLLIIQ